jgi:hypothetical protein
MWTDIWSNIKRAITLTKINHIFGILIGHDLSMYILYRFHGWLIFGRVIALFMFVWPYVYQIWIKWDKRQMTSCVHKMCGRTYGQTNMKRAMTLAKINHPWNQYNMCMLRSWPTKFVGPYVRSHILCTQLIICLLSHFIHIWYLGWPCSEHAHIIPIMKRAMTLAKINHPWNQYNMCMLRSWPTKIPNMNKLRQKTND